MIPGISYEYTLPPSLKIRDPQRTTEDENTKREGRKERKKERSRQQETEQEAHENKMKTEGDEREQECTAKSGEEDKVTVNVAYM